MDASVVVEVATSGPVCERIQKLCSVILHHFRNHSSVSLQIVISVVERESMISAEELKTCVMRLCLQRS